MEARIIEDCLVDVTEIVFETSPAHGAARGIGLVFGRMTPAVKSGIELLKACFQRERVLLYFRPFDDGGIGLSFIVRETLMIANSGPLQYNERSFELFASGLHREERLLLTCYQRDRNGRLRFIPDARYDPYVLPAHFFRSAHLPVSDAHPA